MHAWVVVEAEHDGLVAAALRRAWRGAAAVARLSLPARRGPRELLFVWPEGAAAVRPPRWPDVLTDWHDIYRDELFPDGDALPVLAEELSSLGPEVLALHAAPGLAGATVGWFEKGALALYEHVGDATVSWSEKDGLGRPPDGTLSSAAAGFVLDRIALQNRATGEALLERALHRILAHDPPAFDELAGMVVSAPRQEL